MVGDALVEHSCAAMRRCDAFYATHFMEIGENSFEHEA